MKLHFVGGETLELEEDDSQAQQIVQDFIQFVREQRPCSKCNYHVKDGRWLFINLALVTFVELKEFSS